MTTIAWLLMDDNEKDDAVALNGEGVGVNPRLIDNPLADNQEFGDIVGLWVMPARLLVDPDYERWYDLCSEFPIRTMDSDILFLPPVEEE